MSRGFTLIELLVVITIIVVLLALLTPALDRAIYEAEMAVDGARFNTIATGVVVYASENRRLYPYREGVYSPGWYPQYAVQQGQTNKHFNDRPALSKVMSLNEALNDPFAPDIEIENAPDSNWIWTATNLWFGFKYHQDGGMRKLGDDLEFSNKGAQAVFRSRVVASDYDRQSATFFTGSHPDRDNLLAPVGLEDQDAAPVDKVANSDPDFRYSLSRFQGGQGRGLIDMNFAYDDGAVIRLRDIAMDAFDESVDGRVVKVGVNTAANGYPTSWDFLPRQK